MPPSTIARAAENAGGRGDNTLLIHYAQIALAQAKVAQRTGSNAPSDDAIVTLKKSLEEGQRNQTQDAMQNVNVARERLSHAADVRVVESENRIL